MNLLSEGHLKIFGTLNCRLLGDKSPFSQQNLQGDAMDRDEETARIQCKLFYFFIFFYHSGN
jgi:hypothetical protein